MLVAGETPFRRDLEGDLVLRTAACEDDVARVAEFNALIHGPGVGPMTRSLFLAHPDTTGRDLVFVEDRSGCVVSSICLVPWDLRYHDIALLSGEQAIVGTLDAFRHRGLIRQQVEFFKLRLRERGCLLSHIQGIPYFYRQFGYQYALPLEGGLKLEVQQVPPLFGLPHRVRPATVADIPDLARLYDAAALDLPLHAARSEAVWRYLLEHTSGTEMECETSVVESPDGRIAGYWRTPAHHFGDELAVNEVSRLDFEAALAALNHLKTVAEERHTPGIRLNLPAGSTLTRLARSLGARDLGTYAWQIHVPEAGALLRTLMPVLTERLAASPFRQLNYDLRLNLYRGAFLLRIVAGRLLSVTDLGFTGGGDVNCPPEAFVPLVLGYRTFDELRAVYPDLSAQPRWRLLTDTLFPKAGSFLYTAY